MAGTNSKAQAQQNGNGKFVREVRSEAQESSLAYKKRACELYDCRIYRLVILISVIIGIVDTVFAETF